MYNFSCRMPTWTLRYLTGKSTRTSTELYPVTMTLTQPDQLSSESTTGPMLERYSRVFQRVLQDMDMYVHLIVFLIYDIININMFNKHLNILINAEMLIVKKDISKRDIHKVVLKILKVTCRKRILQKNQCLRQKNIHTHTEKKIYANDVPKMLHNC